MLAPVLQNSNGIKNSLSRYPGEATRKMKTVILEKSREIAT